MTGGERQTKLAQEIAAIVRRRRNSSTGTGTAIRGRCLLMTGVALAVLQTQNAGALTLGELRVQSAIGQPFVASTTARIGPGESLSSACVSAPTGSDNGFTNPPGLTVSAQSGSTPGVYPLQIRSAQPLYEPMYEIRLLVDCPGGVALAKSYVVMLNLPMTRTAAPASEPSSATPATAPSRSRTAAAGAALPGRNASTNRSSGASDRLRPSAEPIAAGDRYRVRSGDTLSAIAERVNGRPVGSTWQVADMLFERNPQAFVRGDRDRLKLGAVLEIPDRATLNGNDTPAPARQAAVAPLRPASSGDAAGSAALSRREDAVPDSAPATEIAAVSNTAASNAAVSNAAVSNEALLAEIRAANAAAMREPAAATSGSPFADEALTDEAPVDDTDNSGAATGNSKPAPVATQPGNISPTTADTASESVTAVGTPDSPRSSMSPLIAVAAGIGLGALLALLLLGRNLLATLRDARLRREAAHARPALEPEDNSRELKPVRPAYGGAGIQVEVGSSAAEMDDPEADTSTATYEAPKFDQQDVHTANLDAAAAPQTPSTAAPSEPPRVSLRPDNSSGLTADFDDMLEDLEHTERFEAPALNSPAAEPAAQDSELSDSQTMRSLFQTADAADEGLEFDDDETAEFTAKLSTDSSATAEMPALNTATEDDDALDIDLTDLNSLSRRLEDTADDSLSKTLTQALGLLEKDYEDELTASQVLDKEEVENAFGAHRRKD